MWLYEAVLTVWAVKSVGAGYGWVRRGYLDY